MKNYKINEENNEIVFEIKTNVYPLEIIKRAGYVFIDRAYVYLDILKKGTAAVFLKGKRKLKKNELEALQGEFFNELLNVALRENLAKRNQKVLEYIVGGAITASLPKKEEKKDKLFDLDQEIENLKKELDIIEEDDFEKDLLEIKKVSQANRKRKNKK